jgi:hypothetical protein
MDLRLAPEEKLDTMIYFPLLFFFNETMFCLRTLFLFAGLSLLRYLLTKTSTTFSRPHT